MMGIIHHGSCITAIRNEKHVAIGRHERLGVCIDALECAQTDEMITLHLFANRLDQ